ncbi:glycosyltransferase family 2 protein [Crenothrix sp.]|uniref:glycosyltransferase family 2 protein n=1 Tax=Crenothrix sp. TaxID=3100433 RepID=UPI00374D53FA
MLCSIIIPLYNKASFIEEALQSIFNQTYQNFEVIIIDDGSTDDGVVRVRAIKDSRVALVQQSNAGVSCARNKGIELAQGDLVCFLDADDWYQPQYLDTIIKMAKCYPELLFFATSYKRVKVTEGTEKYWEVADQCDIEIINDLFHQCRLGSTLFIIDSFAVRRSSLLHFQPYFPPGEQMAEDQDLYFRLCEKSAFAYCSLPLAGYRIGINDSLCATYEGSCLFPAYLRVEQRALNREMPDRLRSSALRMVAEARISLARNSLMTGQRYQGVKELLGVWRGMVSRRWWVTLAMCVFATPKTVQRWEHWRNQKA